ncbi:MAG: RsfS/YbeB/iojap family protein, partial [Bacteroidota bacterium]
MKKETEEKEDLLFDVIIESLKNKKGKEIVSIDLRKIDNSVCDYFVICHGTSKVHVEAIA